MSKSKTIVMRVIAGLQTNLFVREGLNQEHALYLGELIENGIKLPPIQITPEGVIIDGRHRVEAHILNNLHEIECEIVEVGGEAELIAAAYKANVGGSLPPSPQDTEHTIMLLLERGEPKKRIGECLGLPASMARRYIDKVQSKAARIKLTKAASAVTDGGLSLPRAADQYEVDPEQLKEMLSGHKKRHKLGGVAETQRQLTKTFKSVSSKNGAMFRGLLEKYGDGDVTESQVRKIIKHTEDLQKKSARATADWKKRFDALTGKTTKVAKTA